MAVDWTWASPLPHDASATVRQDKSLHAKWVMITCDHGGRRLASSGYKYGTARAIPVHLSLLRLPFFTSSFNPSTMAPIHRFSAEEKGKAPREGPVPLPLKKRPVPCRRDEGAWRETSRPWYERPPPGFPLPLYAQAEGPGEEGAERRYLRHRRITAVRVVPPGVHAANSSRELVLHAAMPPSS